MSRFQFSLRRLFQFCLGCAVLLGLYALAIWPIQRSGIEKDKLARFCEFRSGSFWMGMVDADVHIELKDRSITKDDLRTLRSSWARVHGKRWYSPANVYLQLRDCQLEPGALGELNEQVVSLQLPNTNVDDLAVADALGRCPHLWKINLSSTLISKQAIRLMADRPYLMVIAHDTAITAADLIEFDQVFLQDVDIGPEMDAQSSAIP